jgi:hypothetical protein
MSAILKTDRVIRALREAGASMRCSELKKLLEDLGFEVRDGKKGGHKVFFHWGLKDFSAAAYNCDHGKNPEIKRPYINKVIRVIERYKSDLQAFLEENER